MDLLDRLKPVAEDNVPEWLWRKAPDEEQLAQLDKEPKRVGETSARQVCEIAPRVLHHLDQVDSVILDHRPVDPDHLFGGQIRDFAGIEWAVHWR